MCVWICCASESLQWCIWWKLKLSKIGSINASFLLLWQLCTGDTKKILWRSLPRLCLCCCLTAFGLVHAQDRLSFLHYQLCASSTPDINISSQIRLKAKVRYDRSVCYFCWNAVHVDKRTHILEYAHLDTSIPRVLSLFVFRQFSPAAGGGGEEEGEGGLVDSSSESLSSWSHGRLTVSLLHLAETLKRIEKKTGGKAF